MEAFAGDWGFVARGFDEWHRHRIEGEAFDPGLWIVALDGSEVAGVAACAVRGGIGYVDNVAVCPAWRRQGNPNQEDRGYRAQEVSRHHAVSPWPACCQGRGDGLVTKSKLF